MLRKLKSWRQVEFYFSIILGASRDKLGFILLMFFFPLSVSHYMLFFFVLCLWMYLCSYIPRCLPVQKTICRSLFSPSIMWIQGWNSGYHAWRQAPLLTEPSHQARVVYGSVFCNIDMDFPAMNISDVFLSLQWNNVVHKRQKNV